MFQVKFLSSGFKRIFLFLMGSLAAGILTASQPLETETARLPKMRSLEVGGSFEYQKSSEGVETAAPLFMEYGLTDRLELAVEPVPITVIRPKVGRHASGIGDTEATLSYLVSPEGGGLPALAAAFEIKFPTARDALIGTKKADYTGILIASKQFGRWDTHVNLGYAVLGNPPGVKLKNIFNFAAAGEYRLNQQWDLVGEFLADTSAASGSGDNATNGVSAEAAGGERVGVLGTRCHLSRNLVLALGVTYDNNSAVLIRPGVTWKF